MINRKIATSAISIVTALALMGGATFAFFNSTATSANNTFTSGTLDLFVDDDNESAVDNSVIGSISASNFAPGQTVNGFVSLHNPGSLAIAEIELTADTSETADPGADSDMRDVLNLTVLLDDTTTPDSACAGGTDLTTTIEGVVGDGDATLTLAEFDNGTDDYDALQGLTAGQTRNVCFAVEFDSDAGNIYEGDAVNTTFTFTANQDASQ